jgi:hypothetical protein
MQPVMAVPSDAQVTADQPAPSDALTPVATTGIYLVRGVPRGVQRAARARAASEGTTLRRVLLQAMRDYAGGTWTPRPGEKSPTPPTAE